MPGNSLWRNDPGPTRDFCGAAVAVLLTYSCCTTLKSKALASSIFSSATDQAVSRPQTAVQAPKETLNPKK